MASTQASQPAGSSEQGKILLGFNLRYRLHGHEGTISRIAWSPDGRVLASGSNDHTIRLWDMETAPGTSCRVLAGHTGWVYSIA
jgi:WD40 repeat protein